MRNYQKKLTAHLVGTKSIGGRFYTVDAFSWFEKNCS